MPPPTQIPIGLQLTRTAHLLAQEFERAMTAAGASAATWQVLVLVRSRRFATQSKLAEEMGITGATLTHHLNALEAQGLVTRTRDPDNRRVQRVDLTEDGIALFDRLRSVAGRHDQRLRAGLTEAELEQLRLLLGKLQGGVGPAAA